MSTIEISKDGVKLSYRHVLTDLATGLVVILLMLYHMPLFVDARPPSAGVLVILLVTSSPLGVAISSASFLFLSLPVFLAEYAVVYVAAKHPLCSLVVSPGAQRVYDLHSNLPADPLSFKEYNRITSIAENTLLKDDPMGWRYYRHLEGVAIYLRNLVFVLAVYALAVEVYKVTPVLDAPVIYLCAFVVFVADVHVVVFARAFLLSYTKAMGSR